MEYGNIPEELLDLELGGFYTEEGGFNRYTLRHELDTVDEDILHVEYETDGEDSLGYPVIRTFTAWTENHVLQLAQNPFNEQNLLVIPRNPIR